MPISGDDALHARIKRTRDEYVRSIYLDDHAKQLLRDRTREGLKGTNTRLDLVLAVLTQDKTV